MTMHGLRARTDELSGEFNDHLRICDVNLYVNFDLRITTLFSIS